jgi:uncharacterized protein (TIRG00374 family)
VGVKALRVLLGLVISLGLVWLLFAKTDLSALGQALGQANYLFLLPGLAAYFGGVWLRCVRWRLLLAPVADVSTWRLLKAVLIGFTVNNLMVVRLGELVRAWLLYRWQGVPPGATIGSIVIERLFDGLTLCAILVLAWLYLPLSPILSLTALVGGAIFLGGTAALVLAACRPDWTLRLIGLLTGLLPGGLGERAFRLGQGFVDGLAVLRQGRTLLLVALLSVLAWLGEALLYFVVMLGFGFDAGLMGSLLGMAAANFGIMVPSLPGFIGTFHKPLQAVLTDLFGIDYNLATSYTLVVHAALILPVVTVGAALLWREGLSVAEVSRRAVSFGRAQRPSPESAARPL